MTQQVDALKARLQEAVALEEYEEAARLRDEIGRLEHSIEK
ncbi:MAG: UvrB/UvrC motif-containing protein [Gemmatimonadota bacterium]|nr:UvrB/UvrC motif-containing protein [Gemmatimonadota bacterium]